MDKHDLQEAMLELVKLAHEAKDALWDEVNAAGDDDHPTIKAHAEIAEALGKALARVTGEEVCLMRIFQNIDTETAGKIGRALALADTRKLREVSSKPKEQP
jgi:hypothetical protein